MLGLESDYPQLINNPTPKDCIRWLRALTYWVGPGFHPDIRAADYVNVRGRSFSPELCAVFDADLAYCHASLEAIGREPYAVAIKPQRRMITRMRNS